MFLRCVLMLILVLRVENSLIDDEYDEIFVERYLFSIYSNESTYWRKLDNIRSGWQVECLPEYHCQSSKGFWLLNEKENEINSYEMSFISIELNSTIFHLTNLNISSNGTYLLSSTNEQTKDNWTFILICPISIRFVLCDEMNASLCLIKKEIFFPKELNNKTREITSSLIVNEYLFFGSDSGFHSFNIQTNEFNLNLNSIDEYVSSLSYSIRYKTLFIGTNTKLWIQTYENNKINVRFEHINGLIDESITSLVYDKIDDRLWIGQSTGITYLYPIQLSTGQIHWYFVRLSGQISNPGGTKGGLPYSNITKLIISNDNSIWLGSIYGLIRYNNKTSSNRNDIWRVFNSGRYLPNRDLIVNICSIISLPQSNQIIAITNRGLTRIQIQKWNLEKKSKYFQDLIDKSTRHNRYNYISDCSMSLWANPNSCIKQSNDNDGLWTSMYLASQIYRYKIENNSQIQLNAWKHFEALEVLNHVTGIQGYPSRSIARKGEYPPQYNWYSSPVNQSLDFEGDTSSDEIVGHQFIYPLVIDYLSINQQQRSRAFQLLFDQINTILDKNYYLIGENHNHTTWGIWNPLEINNNSYYQETRGLNSLQIFSFIFQIYSFTKNESYLKHIEYLIDKHGYDINLINQKMISICDIDYSDDELAYLSYLNLINAFQRLNQTNSLINSLKEYLFIGLELSHQYKQMEKSPFYNFIYCLLFKQMKIESKLNCSQLIEDSIWYLQRFPLDLINYRQYNKQRLDIQINSYANCNRDNPYSYRSLPPNERPIHKWNDGTFDLDGGDGFQEEDPSVFLLPYWGIRYLLFLQN